MGGEHDVCALRQELLDLAQRLVNLNVGVDIKHLLVPTIQQVLQGPGLDGGVELQHVVLEQEILAVRQRERLNADGFEFIGQRQRRGRVGIHDHAVEPGAGMMARRALQQGACEVQVVVADNGKDGGLGHAHIWRGLFDGPASKAKDAAGVLTLTIVMDGSSLPCCQQRSCRA